MWRTAREMAFEPDNVELVLYLDTDDPQLLNYQQLALSDHVQPVVGDRITFSQMWNECAARAVGDIMWLGNDDVLFQSEGWDGYVLDAFSEVKDRILYVHGRDAIQDGRLGTLGFLHRRWVDEVG